MFTDKMEEKRIIDHLMHHSFHHVGLVYDFIMVTSTMISTPRHYKNGMDLTVIEMSTVLEITNNPGIIATELCKKWSRTRSAISQLLKKLERKDLIYREKEKGEDKIVHLYPTVEGIKLRNVVVMNESSDTTQLFHDLLRKGCTQQDLESFYKVIGCYTQELLERPGSNWSNLIPEIGE